MNRVYRSILSLSLIASCAGVIGLSAAKAQDMDDVALRQQIRQYQQDMRGDQAQLNNLERQRRILVRNEGSRYQIRSLDQQISMLNRHILRDQELIRRDQHQLNGWEERTPPPPAHRNWHRMPPPGRTNNPRWNGDNP
ncbi:MAG TPA: hypothetical protein VFA07_13605 [Chthonomonadaceae bacterium]|nr:hypothetical protein [Chthonomonadaceae bacterium]